MSVLCVGDDGHLAIEVLLEGECGDCIHGCQQSELGPGLEVDIRNSDGRHCGGCVDIPLNLGVMEKLARCAEGQGLVQLSLKEFGSIRVYPGLNPYEVKPLFGCGPPGSSLILRSSISSVRLLI